MLIIKFGFLIIIKRENLLQSLRFDLFFKLFNQNRILNLFFPIVKGYY